MNRLGLLVLLALPCCSLGDPVDIQVRRFMAFHMVPGLSLAIVREGKPIEVRTYGMANIEAPSKVRKESVFKIGSLSKQFLATDIMLLQQDGKLNIADPISKYIPDVPESWRGITIRHVLNHSAGFVGEPLNWDAIEKRPLIEYIRSNYQEPLLSKPGEKSLYSNFGYFVIAEIVNRVSGKSWDAFTDERIFRPVGMKRSFVNHFWRVVPGRAMGYETNYGDDPMTGENALENGFNYYSQRPSGGFISTALDLAKWDLALRGNAILTEESKKQMFSPLQTGGTTPQYGLGWEISAKAGHPVVRHNGSVPGFRSTMQRYIRDDLTIIVLCNNGGAPAEDLGERVTELLLPDLKPAPPQAISAGSATRFNVVKRFLETRTAATPDPKLMTEACIADLNWKAGARRFMGFGKLIKLTRVEKRQRDSEAVWRYRALFEHTEVDALVEFQGDRISDIAVALA